MDRSIRCHYDVLDVSRDADVTAIKKAHRKLALKFHPDKNHGCEEAVKEFRLVQQAYECLSDPPERKWYDEHREVILRGGQGFSDSSIDADIKILFLFDVTPYHFSGCYEHYGDGERGFFCTYQYVFSKVMDGEKSGWISEGNVDESKMPIFYLPTNFGNSSSEWSDVLVFYNSWESFSSCLSFSWADKYDPREAESRWERRRVDEENKKARRLAKKARNEDIVNFVTFVKKRDPRVKIAREVAEQERRQKEMTKKREAEARKAQNTIARESWILERQKLIKETEIEDMNAGRIRLADLEDSDDDYGIRKGKKGKRGKKEKEKKYNNVFLEKEDRIAKKSTGENFANSCIVNSQHDIAVNHTDVGEDKAQLQIWRCECCRKDFKSQNQLTNHLKSKKHKEKFKKYNSSI